MVNAGGREYERPLANILTSNRVSITLFRHPDKIRTNYIRDFVDELEYDDYYRPNIPISERSPAWLEARKFYNGILAECRNVKYSRDHIRSQGRTK